MPVRRIEEPKIEEVVKKIDPLQEPNMVTKDDILGVAIPKKSDMEFAKYSQKLAEDIETGLKFNIAITKTRR